MKFSELSKYLEKLEKTSSRIEITNILAGLFKESSATEIDKIVYLLLGSLAPSYEGVVFNLAERMMVKAVAQAYDIPDDEAKKEYKEKGDLGTLAESFDKKKVSAVTVNEVYDKLINIAEAGGEGSQEEKISQMASLLEGLDALSARYVARIPVGKLRLGFSDKTVIDALSVMEKGDKSGRKELEQIYEVLPDVGALASEVKKRGIKEVSKNPTPKVGVPIAPMLAQRLKSPAEMIKKMGEVAVEPKFDGLRAQIHYKKGEKVKVFTRNLNEISEMFPEIQKAGKYINAKSAILDSEAVGLDPKTKKMVDFQRTMQRRRKHDIARMVADIPLRFQVFDLMFVNGKNLMGEGYEKRRAALKKVIKKNSLLVVDDHTPTDNPELIRKLHHEMVQKGLEGVMVKKSASKYVPGRTGWRWVKMKEAEEKEGKLADTMDCIVMGYTRGKGKRAAFGIGQFLAGVKSGDRFVTITKVGTGLTDEQFKELVKRLKKIEVSKKPKEYEVHKNLEPDFWVAPKEVVELAADEITVSPNHTAGLALRFPRLIKFRDDKSANEVTNLREIKNLSKLQKK